jgi:hypothetical protein
VEDDYCDIQEIQNSSESKHIISEIADDANVHAVMYPEGGYFNSSLQSEEDYVKVV